MTYLFNLEDITWNDLWGLNFEETTITKNDGLEGESLLEFVDDRTSLVLLDETDGGVEQKEGADDTEIDPILKTCSKDGSSL